MPYALDRSRDAIFVERLHAKTLSRSLDWTPTEHEGRYQVRLGDYVVEIGEGAATAHGPEILLCGADGRALEVITPEMLDDAYEERTAAARREAFEQTYEAARRTALGVDAAIDTLITALK
jgi:hypothetical protein